MFNQYANAVIINDDIRVVTKKKEEVLVSPVTINIFDDQVNGTKQRSMARTGTNSWGPNYWFVIHHSAAYYSNNPTQSEQTGMFQFILSIPTILPCSICKGHAREFLEENYQYLKRVVTNKQFLFRFFVDFHNSVNVRTGKQSMSYAEAESRWNPV